MQKLTILFLTSFVTIQLQAQTIDFTQEYRWDGAWSTTPFSTSDYDCDENNRVLSITTETDLNFGTGMPADPYVSTIILYEYGENDWVSLIERSSFGPGGNQQGGTRQERELGELMQSSTFLTFVNSTQEWEPNRRNIFEYESAEFLELEAYSLYTQELWNSTTETFEPFRKFERELDSDGLAVENDIFQWDGSAFVLVSEISCTTNGDERECLTYDVANGGSTLVSRTRTIGSVASGTVVSESFVLETEGWNLTGRTTQEFNNLGNTTFFLSEILNMTTGEVVDIYDRVYNYNEDDNLIEFIERQVNQVDFNTGQDTALENAIRILYTLKDDVNIVQSLDPLRLEFYPNPAKNKILIRENTATAAGYRLQTMSGATLLEGKIDSSNQIDISQLPPGAYLLNLDTDSGRLQEILIKD